MWTLKHDTSSPKFYELLTNTELKGETALDLKNFYNHINMCITEENRPREYLLPANQYIKRHSEYEEYFAPYFDHPSYCWDAQTYNSLVHSLLVELTNNTYVKYSMEHQAYIVVNYHDHEISVWKILSRIIHARAYNPGGMNGDLQSDISTLESNNR